MTEDRGKVYQSSSASEAVSRAPEIMKPSFLQIFVSGLICEP